MILEIIFTTDHIAAVNIAANVYYIRLDSRLPEVYDANGLKLSISDYDSWALKETRSKYRYANIVELCQYWRQGYIANSINTDLDKFIETIILKTKEEIFTSDLAREYANEYWIECTPQSKMSEKIIDPLIKKKNELISKLGYQTVSNYLNRIRRVITEQNDIAKLDRFMKMFNISDARIEYPATKDIDKKLVTRMKHEINREPFNESISKDVKSTCILCESKIL